MHPVRHLLLRVPLVLGLGALAAVLRLLAPPVPAPNARAVAAMLGRAAGGQVGEDELVWEPSRGLLADALWGRRVLLLASLPGARSDLFRARVRTSRGGRPIGVLDIRNLTQTPLGDEQALRARGRHAAVLTRAWGAVQGVTVLDLGGEDRSGLGPGGRIAAALQSWLRDGCARGIGRTEVVFAQPPAAAEIELRGGRLVLSLETAASERQAVSLDLLDAPPELDPVGSDGLGAMAWTTPATPRSVAELAGQALGVLTGPAGPEALERAILCTRSVLMRLGAALCGSLRGRPRRAPAPAAARSLPPEQGSGWPPPAVGPLFTPALAGEGEWRAPLAGSAPRQGSPAPAGSADPSLLETTIRPDPDLPAAELRLVAIDTRQLELHVEAGASDPTPLAGPRGRGRIGPRDLPRAVAAFGGGLHAGANTGGVVAGGRVLVPPIAGAASVAVDVHGRAYLGSWGPAPALPGGLGSLWQGIDPLLDPAEGTGRDYRAGGFARAAPDLLVERSALCLTAHGYLIYGWSHEASATTLARGLELAGCTWGAQIDASLGDQGFVYLSAEGSAIRAAKLDPAMSVAPRRFIAGSPASFLYLVRRAQRPRTRADLPWRPDGAEQPAPHWLPAVHGAGAERLSVEIELRSFSPDRFAWRIRPGREESGAATALTALDPAEHARALCAIGLGVASRKHNRRGLVLGGAVSLPIRPGLGVLSIDRDGTRLAIGIATEQLAPRGDATELPLLADGGELRSEARELGRLRWRTGGCAMGDGTLLVARSRSDSGEANARALLDAGCRRVVALDRGRQVEAFVHRAGSPSPPRAEYDETTLYALAIEGRGTARRIEAVW
ncbi:MAG: hypothetical protein HY744_20705 [Deltaproteobacteria bacterium]|nr:hypothetical protein [Deltaproteobacteria bacterium]